MYQFRMILIILLILESFLSFSQFLPSFLLILLQLLTTIILNFNFH